MRVAYSGNMSCGSSENMMQSCLWPWVLQWARRMPSRRKPAFSIVRIEAWLSAAASANTRRSPSWRKPQIAARRSACEPTPRPRACGKTDRESPDFLVFAELQVDEAKRTVVGRICDHEGCSSARAPLLLGSGDAVALSIRCERLIVHSPPRFGVKRCLRYQRHISVSHHP